MGFWGMLTGSDAADTARAAAADTDAKQLAAINDLKTYGNTLPDIYRQLYGDYSAVGKPALNLLSSGLGLNGSQGSQEFTDAYRASPGYTSGLATGQQAAERGLNAGGGLRSGGALKALYRYGSDYENGRSGDFMSRLQNLGNIGLQGTQGVAQGIQGQLGTRTAAFGGQMTNAPTIGQGMVAGAQSEQDAIGNLLKTAAYLGGSALGGPIGSAAGAGLSKWMSGGGSGGVTAGSYGGVPYPIFG